ncbi:MAG: cupin domain-containing protein [Alphaproteobacteria bacterium]|nr:cupin domain-containing protein [Alphaproteobacteria bacterium]MBU0804956.1 cupin domain-containing protein [Alphaproteobacteria bacterium]MBU0870455.1 cupin domain-containing protein [Alphaproteobacteria bacterium]MBU1401870.1 cupin domain-containing protein [Alphaproteobacteria bacterium]MBU1591713.1 cupin domain-containing protein [Alphaproteobacteria bacterium]
MQETAAGIIAALGLERHPEGGWYAETFRDNSDGGRGHSTAIYFLLEQGDVSAWHRVRDAAEVWHHYAGAPLELTICDEGGKRSRHLLGSDLAAGERPQAVVPAGWWQTARSLGAWTLCGCTVAPGFDFAQFELAEAGWEP